MSLFVTPSQFTRRAELYHQLAQLTAAGIGIVPALEQVKRHPPSRAFREPLQLMLAEIARGRTFAQAAANAGDWLPEFDLALLHAGETTGRLDACCRDLADHYNTRAQLAKNLIGQLFYPVALIHFAAFVFLIILPFAAAGLNFDAHLVWLFIRAALVLAPLYGATALLVYALQSKHGEAWRATIEAALHRIPLLGRARQYLALARLATALEALIRAGVNIIEAWELAARASGSPALRKIVADWKPQLASGRTPADLVSATPRFPEMFANLYATGEISGKLEESLGSLRRYYQEEGARKLQFLANLAPKLVYLIVALVIAYNIIQFWTGYFQQINDATKM